MPKYILCASLDFALAESREVACQKCKTKLALSKASEESWGEELSPICFNCWHQLEEVRSGQPFKFPSDLEIKAVAAKLDLPFEEVKKTLTNLISDSQRR